MKTVIATTTIPFTFVPIQMITTGANAVFGSELNTTKKGESIFCKKGIYQRITATKKRKQKPTITYVSF